MARERLQRNVRAAGRNRQHDAQSADADADADADIVSQRDNIAQLSEISRNSQTTFLALIAACVYSYLTIATTTDAALLSNSSATPLPIIQVNVPIVWFYYFAPLILTVLFVYFHLYLERFWRGLARLPLRHPDGRGLDDYVYPWLISCAVIRGEIRELAAAHRVSARLEAWLCLFLGWGLVPIVLIFYWGRYAVAHDRWGTLLHIMLVLLSVGFALHYVFTARNALRQMGLNAESGAASPALAAAGLSRHQNGAVAATLCLLGVALLYQSGAAVFSLSDSDCEGAGSRSTCAFYRPGRMAWSALGVKPYADIKEGRFVKKPDQWQKLLANPQALRDYLDTQPALALRGSDLHNMDASNAFMPGSHLSGASLNFADLGHAVMAASRLDSVSLLGAKLTDTSLQHAEIVDSHFDEVSAVASNFEYATFNASDSRGSMRLSGDFSSASFEHASGDGLLVNTDLGNVAMRNQTSLRGASLRSVSFRWSHFNHVDFGTARIEDAKLTHSVFTDADFSGAILRRSFMNFSVFTRCRFVAADIEDAVFEEARFEASEFDNARATTPATSDKGPASVAGPRRRVLLFQAVLASFDADTSLRNLHFVDADLRSARFSGTKLQNVLFSTSSDVPAARSDLSGAVFDKVDVSEVEFRNVDLSGADLSTALGVQPELLAGACGNRHTRLPAGHSIKPCRPETP